MESQPISGDDISKTHDKWHSEEEAPKIQNIWSDDIRIIWNDTQIPAVLYFTLPEFEKAQGQVFMYLKKLYDNIQWLAS